MEFCSIQKENHVNHRTADRKNSRFPIHDILWTDSGRTNLYHPNVFDLRTKPPKIQRYHGRWSGCCLPERRFWSARICVHHRHDLLSFSWTRGLPIYRHCLVGTYLLGFRTLSLRQSDCTIRSDFLVWMRHLRPSDCPVVFRWRSIGVRVVGQTHWVRETEFMTTLPDLIFYN